ncbi:MAG: type I methionyl aminopeptidase [Pirellulales bacterium]|nr:type I methionyl aminopeptidase [Pirellulales bacterium]
MRRSTEKSTQLPSLKSARELSLMRRAGIVNWGAHQIIKRMVKPGATTLEIDQAVERYFAKHQAIPLFKGVPGKIPFPAVCCISLNDEVVHGIPKNKPLVEGDIVSIDTGCRLNGWCADSALTHAVGKVHPETQRLLDVTLGCLNLAIDLMGKKKYWGEVAEQMAIFVRSAGYSVVENFVGHGIGRGMHEEPQVPNFVNTAFRRNHDFKLEPGLVIAVEPMVNMGSKKVKAHPDQWTQTTQDGRPSAHFEHTVAITENGPWVLTAAPQPEEFAQYQLPVIE